MFEQFFFQKRHIKDASFHYSHISPEFKQKWLETLPLEEREHAKQPDAQLDDATVASLARVNYRKNTLNQLSNLSFAIYDMLVHSPASHQALEATNLTELFNKTKTSILGISGGEAVGDGWGWGHGESVFRNIHNAYDAGYYSYLMLVLACASRTTALKCRANVYS
jgi:metallopeptidase MepB